MKVKIAALVVTGFAVAGISALSLRAQDMSKSVWDGVYTQAQADRGKPLYNSSCGSCHGESLNGGEMAPPLAGGEFLSNWNGLSVGDLFDRIRTTMPLNKPGSLNRETNADITAYILAFNTFPAGQSELSSKSEVLKTVRIDSQKPSK